MEKRFIIKCRNCRWREVSTGISPDLTHLVEIKKNCKTCGGPRKFRCPECGMAATMFRVAKR